MKPLNNQTIKDVLGSLGITGNNVYDSVIQQGDNNSVIVVVINIGHTTYGDNSPIDSDITVADSIIHQSNASGNNIHGTHVTQC